MIEEILVKQFIGKYTLASVDSSHRTVYATPMTERGSDVSAPAMAATSVGANETWLAYGTETGVILQMGNLQYLAQMDDVGMVVATDDVTCASRFRWLAVDPMTPAANTTLEIWVDGRGWQPVRYGFTSDPREFSGVSARRGSVRRRGIGLYVRPNNDHTVAEYDPGDEVGGWRRPAGCRSFRRRTQRGRSQRGST